MSSDPFDSVPIGQLAAPTEPPQTRWLWHGYLARGNITLLTSRWKAGKTTLLAGLLRQLGTGGQLLDRPCVPATVLVVSEESRHLWADRQRVIPVGDRARLLARPFPRRPTPAEWERLAVRAEEMAAGGGLDLFVVDPLASFLPGHSESDPGTLFALLDPLRRLADTGVAVLVLHHPRKANAEEGSTARGSGALLGYVDVILELYRHGRAKADDRRRRLVGQSRHPDTPRSVVYEWAAGTPDFPVIGDVSARQFEDNWKQVQVILDRRREPATPAELLADWPLDQGPPSARQLYEWLSRAADEGLVKRTGSGTKGNPYRFRLPRQSDMHDLPRMDILDIDPPLDRLPEKYRN